GRFKHWIGLLRSKNNDCIGVQVLHLRCSMTGSVWEKRTDSSLIVQNWKCVGEGFEAKRKENRCLSSLPLWNGESQNNINNDCIGVQVLHLRCRMTGSVWEKRTDSSLIVQN